MAAIQILLSHPGYDGSRANRALVDAASGVHGAEVAHLDSLYPDGRIDVDAEVARLLAAERLVLQFPVQWYSTPPLLKAWQDAVLSRMFYIHPETEGVRLAGRPVLVAATAGNTPEAYSPAGVNLFPLAELLKPLRSTASRCGLRWREPFLVMRTRGAADEALKDAGARYADRLRRFAAEG